MKNNPLVSFREQLGLDANEFAGTLNLSTYVVLLHEQGIPHHLHPRYLKVYPGLVDIVPEYYDFRVSKRQHNFVGRVQGVVPNSGPEFAAWLRQLNMRPEVFSALACMPMVDVKYALHHWRLPSTLQRFFTEVTEVSDV